MARGRRTAWVIARRDVRAGRERLEAQGRAGLHGHGRAEASAQVREISPRSGVGRLRWSADRRAEQTGRARIGDLDTRHREDRPWPGSRSGPAPDIRRPAADVRGAAPEVQRRVARRRHKFHASAGRRQTSADPRRSPATAGGRSGSRDQTSVRGGGASMSPLHASGDGQRIWESATRTSSEARRTSGEGWRIHAGLGGPLATGGRPRAAGGGRPAAGGGCDWRGGRGGTGGGRGGGAGSPGRPRPISSAPPTRRGR
jgi:hypothetical protein